MDKAAAPGKTRNKGCFVNEVKSKVAFRPSCQLHELTVRRHKLSAMLRINDWRDICEFDYQENIKGEWKMLLPLLPAIKGWSFLTHPAIKLPFCFDHLIFYMNFLYNKRSIKMYEVLGRRRIKNKKSSL